MSPSDQSATVRELRERDVDAINNLLATHRPWTEYDVQFELTVPEITGRGDARVATVDGSFAGFVWWLPDGAFGTSGYIKLVGVHRAHQSAGVGTALMDAAESAMLTDGGDSDVFLLLSDFNTDALGFYDRRGYDEIGVIEEYVEAGIDEILMRKTA